MRDVSNETRITMNTRRNFVNYAHVTLHDGQELYLTPSDFRISGNSFTDDWSDGEAFQLGSAIGKTATLLLDNTDGRVETIGTTEVVYPHGKFSQYDFYMAYFELKVVLPKAYHDEHGDIQDSELFIGTFTVTTPASHGATIEITGVDNMYMFDKSFDDCALDFDNNGQGQTLLAIINRCCNDCHVAIGYPQDFTNYNLKVYKKPTGITYREVVSYIVQMAGCNAKISPSGALTFGWYNMSIFSEILDGGRFEPWDGVDNVRDIADGGSFNPWTTGDVYDGGDFTTPLGYHNLTATNGTTVSTDDIHFTGVMVSYEVEKDGSSETESVHYPNVENWDDYAMQIADNPFITASNASTIANTVWAAIATLNFRVFSCSSIQDPTIEAGDCALVYDVKGNIYPTVITNVTFTTGGMTNVECKAEAPVRQNQRYVNPAAKAVAKAKENMDAYNTMVAHFNEIANQALGYSSTTIGGVTYLYSGDTLESSQNVVMIQGNGIFISDNYNTPERSWNSGVDITTATMLMNLIYVHGLTADWIVAGNIDADRLKANVITSINNSTGSTTINGGKITTNSITANQIAANAVTASELNAGAVTSDKIAANAVTANKLSVSTLSAISANCGTITSGDISGTKITSNGTGNSLTIDGGEVVSLAPSSSNNSGYVRLYAGPSSGGGHAYELGFSAKLSHARRNSSNYYKQVDSYKIIEAADNASDIRLKTNIEELTFEEAWNYITASKTYSFNFKDNMPQLKRFGMIAQEFEQGLKDCGEDTENLWVLNKNECDGMYCIEYQELIPHLIKVVTTQQEEIDALKQEVELLKQLVNTKQ